MNELDLTIPTTAKISEALIKLNEQSEFLTLLITKNNKIEGTITDGDIRRGFINGKTIDSKVEEIMNKDFIFIVKGEYINTKIDYILKHNIIIVPFLNEHRKLEKILNFKDLKSLIPIDAVIMAGGVGSRLMPLTANTPKPMLKIGEKPIIEYNIDLLKAYGVENIHISVNYLADQITSYFKDGKEKGLNISYLTEDKPLGTIGALKGIEKFHNDFILLMNSDLLTNIDLDAMFRDFKNENADMIIATTDYQVQIPYGVIETENNRITALKEKPTYTYFSNAGIYIFKRELVNHIPENTFFDATDLLELILAKNKKVLHFSIKNYWLDIGKHQDFEKANNDINSIKF